MLLKIQRTQVPKALLRIGVVFLVSLTALFVLSVDKITSAYEKEGVDRGLFMSSSVLEITPPIDIPIKKRDSLGEDTGSGSLGLKEADKGGAVPLEDDERKISKRLSG